MIKSLLFSLICISALGATLSAQNNAALQNKTLTDALISTPLHSVSARNIINNARANTANALATPQFTINNQFHLAPDNASLLSSASASSAAALDVGVVAVVSPQTDDLICQNPFSPIITLQNFGTDVVNTVTINTYINNASTPAYSNIYTGSVAGGTQATFTLVPHTIPTEQIVSLRFEATLPNGQADANASNNSATVSSLLAYTVVNLPYTQSFEDATALGGIAIYNFDQDTFQFRIISGYSAYGVGNRCVYFDNYGFNVNGTFQAPYDTEDWLVMPPMNLSSVSLPSLSFDVAYKGYTEGGYNYSDTLLVIVTSDCFTTYNYVYDEAAPNLSCQNGAAAFTSSGFIPNASDWCTRTIDLSDFAGESVVNIFFVNLSNESNRLFLDNINVKNNCTLTASMSASTNVSCLNGNNGQATVTAANGQAPYTYAWSNGQSAQTATGLAAGTYTVTVTASNNCTATASVTITQPTSGIIAEITDVVNAGCQQYTGSLTAQATGGTTPYTFDLGNGSQTTGAFTGLNAGVYTVTVSDASGCTATIAATVPSSSTVSVTMQSTATTCATNDGTATTTVTGGTTPYTYTWSNGATTANLEALAPGTYVVTVTDLLRCQAIGAVTVTNGCATPCTFDVDVTSQNETCLNSNNGTIAITPVSGTLPFTYAWAHDANNVLNTANNLGAGSYTVSITDAAGCQIERTIGIGQGSSITVDITLQNNNSVAAALVQGGVAPYTYLWSDGSTFSSLVATTAGAYSVAVTDANGCTVVSSVVNLIPVGVNEVEDLQAFTIFPNPNNGSFTVNVQMSKAQDFELILVDVLGRNLATYHFNEMAINMPMNFNNLADGMYFIVLKTANQVKTQKLTIKQ